MKKIIPADFFVPVAYGAALSKPHPVFMAPSACSRDHKDRLVS